MEIVNTRPKKDILFSLILDQNIVRKNHLDAMNAIMKQSNFLAFITIKQSMKVSTLNVNFVISTPKLSTF